MVEAPYRANTPGCCSPGLLRVILRGISPPPKFRISSSWNNDPGIIIREPVVSLSSYSVPPGASYLVSSTNRSASLPVEFSLIKILTSIGKRWAPFVERYR